MCKLDYSRRIFESAADAILVFRPDDECILAVNPAACRLYGYSDCELVGMDLRLLSTDPCRGARAIATVMEKGEIRGFETRHRRRDGQEFRIQVHASLVVYDGLPAILSINRDVTEQRAAEARITESERQYRAMFDGNPQPMWISDAATDRILTANQAALDLYEYPLEEMTTCGVQDLRHEQFDGGSGMEIHQTRSGRIVEVRITVRDMPFEGRPAKLALVRDVTEEQQVRRELARRESWYRCLIENSADLIDVLEPDGTVRFISPSVSRILGRRPEDTVGRSGFEYIHPDDRPKVQEALRKGALSPGATEMVEFRCLHSDGTWRYLEAMGHNLLHIPAVRGIVVHSRDITQRRRTEEALRESEERLRLAQRAASIGTWCTDLADGSVTCCPNNLALFGLKPEEAPANLAGWLDLIHPDDRLVVDSSLVKATSGEPLALEFRVVRPDGSVRWISCRAEMVKIGDSHRMIGANIDITPQKAVERELAAARDQALAASRLKSQFLATVSHEIRTPMNGIVGMTGLLLESGLTDEQRNDAETIRTSALYLLELINDLLDFSRLEAGKLSLEAAPFDLRSCLETIPVLLSAQAESKRLTVSLSWPASMQRIWVGNAGRIRQIVLNFAGNAVKFTSSGSVRIAARRHNGGVRLSVRDTGPGIAKEDQAKLFQKFVQLDGSNTRRHGGTGLGLAISKALADAMGGSVGVSSQPGHGSTFWVDLPLQRASKLPAFTGDNDQQPAHSRPRLRPGVRVLLAEDNSVNQKLVIRLLERRGVRVDVAGNGREALELWRRLPYDLILMDCHMPEMDGMEAARRVRAGLGPSSCVPIIAVTAHATEEEHQRCIAAGMDEILTKPFHAHELDNVLDRWLAGAVRPAPVLVAS